ncbi:AAA family ATPase, partial [Rubellimicrobium roseum]
KIVTVTQARGGIGSSTLAVNLADRLMDRRGLRKVPRNRVVVVDLDIQFGAVASLLDAKENEALYQIAMDGTVPDATFISQALATTPGGLWVLAAPSKFAPLEALTSAQIGALLDALAKQFDYVVVDLPRTLVLWIAAVLERTDRLLLATDGAVPSVRQARRLLDIYLENNPALQVEVVMSQEHKPLIKGSPHREAEKLLERPFRHWLPFDPKAARKASDRGLPLAAVSNSALSKAIAALGRQTLASLAQQTPAHARAH